MRTDEEKKAWEDKGEHGIATSPKEAWDRVMEWARDEWTMPNNNFLQDATLSANAELNRLREENGRLEARLCGAREVAEKCREGLAAQHIDGCSCWICEAWKAIHEYDKFPFAPCRHEGEAKRLREIEARCKDVDGLVKEMTEEISFTANWSWKHFATAISAWLTKGGSVV